MGILRKKNWWQTIMHSYITAGVLLALCVGLSFSVYDRYVIEREVSSRLSEKETELKEVTERKTFLEEKVEYLNGEQGVEAEIRKHFDVAKEGEQVIVLVENEPANQGGTTTAKSEGGASFWSRFLPW